MVILSKSAGSVFDEADDTWEPIDTIYEDIPLILHDFLISQKREDIWSNLITNKDVADA